MGVEAFVAAHRPGWERLEGLLRRMRGGRVTGLGDDVLAFGHLYRQTTSDLAVARRDYPYDHVMVYLNGLVARAHPFVYRGEAMNTRRLRDFYSQTIPRVFRRTLPFTLAALLLTALPTLACYLVAVAHPEAAYVLLPGMAERLVPIVQRHHLWFNGAPGGSESYVASFIMSNNIKVALIAFAEGVLLGLLTVYILVFNGIMLGTLAGVVQHYGLSLGFWSFVVGHGVLDLSVIVIAGGCGLQLGWAILHPGLDTHGVAVVMAAHTAMVLILGAAPLLVVAGAIEGFLSRSPAPVLLKLVTGSATGALLYGYLLTAGRERDRAGPGARGGSPRARRRGPTGTSGGVTPVVVGVDTNASPMGTPPPGTARGRG